MKYCTFWLFLATTIFFINCQASADVNKWVGVWEQTSLYSDTAKKECRIDKLLRFKYVFKAKNDTKIEGIITQTDYRFNITFPPNSNCEFKNTKSKNILLNVKTWQASATLNKDNKTLLVLGHSGECKNDHCPSLKEADFETRVSMSDGYIIDSFGTNNVADDINLLGETERDVLLIRAKKVASKAESYIVKNNCSELYNMLKKSPRKTLADNYVSTCMEMAKSKLQIKSYLENDRFLSFNPSGNHWAVFINTVFYINGTEKREIMYLVFEDNTWKFWGVY